jgi:hypothetical protein
MNNSLPATKADALGVLILEEFATFQAVRFIEFISRPKEYIPNQPLRWRDPRIRPEKGFNSHYGQCDLMVKGQSTDLRLFDLPMSLLPDFNLSDLICPVEIRGCLLLANQGINPSTWRRDRYPGWLDWIQAQKVIYLVAVTGSDAPVLPMSEFLGYLNLESKTQVVELSSHSVGDSMTDHTFDLSSAKQVLTALVENIITNMSHTSDHSE